jgi:hypothetical protein
LAGDFSDLGEDIFEPAVISPHEGGALEAWERDCDFPIMEARSAGFRIEPATVGSGGQWELRAEMRIEVSRGAIEFMPWVLGGKPPRLPGRMVAAMVSDFCANQSKKACPLIEELLFGFLFLGFTQRE